MTIFSHPKPSALTDEELTLASSLEDELEQRLHDVERRERELEQARMALDSQREQLAAVQAEYEARRGALASRAREVEARKARLRDDEARLVTLRLQFELAQTPQTATRLREPMAVSERVWWSKQLGTPLESA